MATATPARSAPSPAIEKVAARPAVPSGATAIGQVAATKAISGDVALVPRDAAALTAYATGVSTPGSPEYRHDLTPSTFAAHFAPSASTVTAVRAQLQAGGLKVTAVRGDGLLVGFSGSARQVDATFHTTIDGYRLSSGQTAFANDSAVQLPAAVAPSVAAVIGLNNLITPEAVPVTQATSGTGGEAAPAVTPPSGAADACSTAADTATSESGLTANQVAAAYGLDPLYKDGDFGQGETIDILDLFGYSSSDLKAFDDCYYGSTEGAAVLANDSTTNVDEGAQPGNGTGGAVETELDVEAVNAYAPQAKVDVYEASNDFGDYGFIDAVAAMTTSSASIESISYGSCEPLEQAEDPGVIQVENYLFEEGATLGKTVFSSSGDDGDDICSDGSGQPVAPILSVSDPASQPFVTGVGGTAITAATEPPAEEVWNDGAAGGAGGGGISSVWPEPAWQADTTVPGINNSTTISEAESVDSNDFCDATYPGVTCREVPDVSAQASPNTGGFPIYADGTWEDIGGTSLASPTWAAILADIDSTPSCTAAGGVGFVSPKLYAIASIPSEYAASFNDITIGNNDNFGAAGGLFPATTGYDMASGLGSPKVTGPGGTDGLAYYLCAALAAPAPTVTGVSPSALSSAAIAAGTTLTVSGSGFSSGTTSDVAALSIGNVTVPASDVDVQSATSIVVTVPSGIIASEEGNGGSSNGAGTYDVTVTQAGGATSPPSAQARVVLYDSSSSGAATPVVDGTIPGAGGDAGGTAVTLYGSGFAEGSVSSVTFGGVPATTFTVVSDNTISATTPALPANPSCLQGDDPTTGVCQVQVQVTLTDGTSSVEGTIPPQFVGDLVTDMTGTGVVAAPTEYDYEPAPTITSVAYVSPPDEASEAGGTVLQINGTGFGALGTEWVNVGSYQNSGSEDYPPTYISSTEIQIALPAEAATTTPLTEPITVQTFGSPNQQPGETLGALPPSNAESITFAPTPTIKTIAVGGHPKTSELAGPTSGGTPLVITGSGLADAEVIAFQDLKYGFPTTQYAFDQVSNDEITLVTPAALTGVYAVEVCNPSGCSTPSTSTYTFYLPGNPALTSDTPKSGKSGAKITITGHNLGYVQAVYFGSTKAKKFSQPSAFFESGDTYEVKATAPKGTVGKKVDIRVETIESQATGYGKSPVDKSVTFTYKKS